MYIYRNGMDELDESESDGGISSKKHSLSSFLREKTVLFNDQQNDPPNQNFPTEW